MSWEPVPGRRDLRRWAAAGIVGALLVVAAGVGARTATGTGSSVHVPGADTSAPVAWGAPPPPPAPAAFAVEVSTPFAVAPARRDPDLRVPGADGHSLVVAGRLALSDVDLGTGEVRRMEIVDQTVGLLTGELDEIDGDVVTTTGGGGVLRISPPGDRVLRLATGQRAVPTSGTDSVWVVDNLATPLGGTATRVHIDGGVADRLTVPDTTRPLAGTADSLIVGGPDVVARLSTDGGRELLARGAAIASDGQRLAWGDCTPDERCAIVIGTVDAPAGPRSTVAAGDLPAGVFGLPAGAFSPDGRWLALPITPGADAGRTTASPRIAVIDTATVIEVATITGGVSAHGSLAWSGDSRWLAIDTAEHITLWDAANDRARRLDIGVRRIRGLAFR